MAESKQLTQLLLVDKLSKANLSKLMLTITHELHHYVRTDARVSDIDSDLLNELDNMHPFLSDIARKLNLQSNQEIQKAYLLGILRNSYEMLQLRKKETEKGRYAGLLTKQPILKQMLEYLNMNNRANQEQLCQTLDLETDILERNYLIGERHNLLDYKEIGDRVYIFITKDGRDLCEYMQNNKTISYELFDRIFSKFIDCIAKEINETSSEEGRLFEKTCEVLNNDTFVKRQHISAKMWRLEVNIEHLKRRNNIRKYNGWLLPMPETQNKWKDNGRPRFIQLMKQVEAGKNESLDD